MKRSLSTVRFFFKGDIERAQQLTGMARKLLSSVEARKGRRDGGFGHRITTLPTGETIEVKSLRGMANITITAPGGGVGEICTDEEVIEIYGGFDPWWAPPARSQWTLYKRFWLLVATGLDGRPAGPDRRGDYSGVIFAKHWQEDKTWGLCDPMGGTDATGDLAPWHKTEMIGIIEYERALNPEGIWGGPPY